MSRSTGYLALALIAVMAGTAHAQLATRSPQDDPKFSNIIYLNDCQPDGCLIEPGESDSTRNRSSIAREKSWISPFGGGPTTWQLITACIRDVYAPFNVEIVDERPPEGVNYHMAIVAGRPGEIDLPPYAGGAAEGTCGYVANTVSFTFANDHLSSIEYICWTIAQETAHSWGLDHKLDERDPMTYLGSGPKRKYFQNEVGPCGEFTERECRCNRTGINSYQEILHVFGSSAPCSTASDCARGFCVDERCVAEPMASLGSACEANSDCASGYCEQTDPSTRLCGGDLPPLKQGPVLGGCQTSGGNAPAWVLLGLVPYVIGRRRITRARPRRR
ncbi:MAG: MYXO-CTERM sorting domain-containing protein [Kofleriaceae bacterium]